MAKAAPSSNPEININLLTAKEPTGVVSQAVHWTLTVARYLIIFTEIVAIAIFVLNIKLATDKQSLRENIRTLAAEVSDQSGFENEFRSVQNRINAVKNQRANQFPNNIVVEKFLTLLPSGMTLDSFEIKDTEITFSGSFSSPRQLQTLISTFSDPKQKEIVALDISELNSPTEKNPKFSFVAKATILQANFEIKEATSGASQINQ